MSRPSIIKLGQGKLAVPVLSIESRNGYTYQISHIPTLALVADGYIYLSLARSIALTLVAELGDALLLKDPLELANCFSEKLCLYLDCYKFKHDCKQALSLEDFLHGPEYTELFNRARSSERDKREESELSEDLCSSDKTLAWLPGTTQESICGSEMDDLTVGRRTHSESFPS